MRIGGKLMEALRTSGNRKLEGLWAGQMKAKKERQESKKESK